MKKQGGIVAHTANYACTRCPFFSGGAAPTAGFVSPQQHDALPEEITLLLVRLYCGTIKGKMRRVGICTRYLYEWTMQYTTTLTEQQPIAITIGNFDGIHKGHQRLMHELCNMAQQLNCTPTLVTFLPHTLMVVRPDIHVEYLTTLEEKLAL